MGCNKKHSFVLIMHGPTLLNGNLKKDSWSGRVSGIKLDETNLHEVDAAEKGGIVYIKQNGKINKSELENALDFFTQGPRAF